MLSCLYVYLRSLLAPLHDERGADLAEYALLLAFVALLAIGGVSTFGLRLGQVWQTIAEAWLAIGP